MCFEVQALFEQDINTILTTIPLSPPSLTTEASIVTTGAIKTIKLTKNLYFP